MRNARGDAGKNRNTLLAVLLMVAMAAIVWGATGNRNRPGSSQEITADAAGEAAHFYDEEALNQHFEKHGAEFGYATAQEYEAGANRVIASPDALHKLEAEDGDDVYYLEETNELVIVSPRGVIRTYFRPDDGLAYYERQ